jgi:hypothetical protein
MQKQPRIFLAFSSLNGGPIAAVLKDLLTSPEIDADVRLWRDSFPPGGTTIGTLGDEADRADYAILILTDDDEVIAAKNGNKQWAPRDNIVFEFGLFSGRIGSERCIAVCDEAKPLKLPTDISGVNLATYDSRVGGDLGNAFAPAWKKIRSRIGGKLRSKASESERAAWDAAREFSQHIAGDWWAFRDWDKDSLSLVHVSIDALSSMPRISGNNFGRDGIARAHWDSVASCVLASEGRLYYYFTGHHLPRNPGGGSASEKYHGFTEYTFDSPYEYPMTGKGEISDRNLRRRWVRTDLTLRLERCTDEADRRKISSLTQQRSRRSSRNWFRRCLGGAVCSIDSLGRRSNSGRSSRRSLLGSIDQVRHRGLHRAHRPP